MHNSSVTETEEILKGIQLILCDVDGVLTDSTKVYDTSGIVVYKTFSDLDTLGFRLAERMRKTYPQVPEVILVSGDMRVNLRFAQVHGVSFVHTGYQSKIVPCKSLMEERDLEVGEVAFVGNDINDLECLRSFISFCPSDALVPIQGVCDFVLNRPGGQGAFRELLDKIVFAKGFTLNDYLECLPPYYEEGLGYEVSVG